MRALLFIAILALAPLGAATGEEVVTYVGPTHPTSARFTSCAAPDGLALNGACFRLAGDEGHARIEVQDASGLPILIHVFMEKPGQAVGADVYTCDAAVEVDVPTDARTLRVWFPADDGVEAPPYCPIVHGEATTGTVAALFDG